MPSNLVLNADADDCGATASWTIPTAADNCELMSFVGTAAPGGYFAVGTTIVTYTAMDTSGNLNAQSFSVTVIDNQDPTFGAPTPDITQDADAGSCSTEVVWSDPNPVDNCGIASTTSTHSSGDSFDFGTTIVTYNTTDVNGRSASFSFSVTVTATDTDSDGTCDAEDTDDDNDGVLDDDDDDSLDPFVCEDSDNDGCDDCSIGVDGFGPSADNTPNNDGTDSDADGLCDLSDNCSNTAACNYADPGNANCLLLDGVCETCSDGTGTGTVVDNDADDDGTCDSADLCPNDGNKTAPGICGCGNVDTDADNDGLCDTDASDNCFDTSACNYADVSNTACITPTGCETCTNIDGTGGVNPNDDDSDGTCNSADLCPNDPNKTAPGTCGCGNVDTDVDNDGLCDTDASDNCFDTSACNYSDVSNAACITPTGCQTCTNTDGTGGTDANDDDSDGTCNAVDGCPNDAAKTAPGVCGCGNVDTDADNDGLCDTDASDNCFNTSACNYADASNAACITPTGCQTCTNTDGTGGTDSNDSDNDGVCDASDNCSDTNACNYAEVSNVACITPTGCESCANSDGTGSTVVSDADNDSICDGNDNCSSTNACNYA
ncbi:MAG: HYR domain-containing protein, partial [Flavobacteriales bacterium]|nr:HYR domain-containing protein [Flavobacteriales bacterium]